MTEYDHQASVRKFATFPSSQTKIVGPLQEQRHDYAAAMWAIVHALRDHPDVTGVVPVGTLLLDRHALDVMDTEGRIWQVHVLAEPRSGGDR